MKLRKNVSDFRTGVASESTRAGFANSEAIVTPTRKRSGPSKPVRLTVTRLSTRSESTQPPTNSMHVKAIRLQLERHRPRQHVAPDRDEQDDEEQSGDEAAPLEDRLRDQGRDAKKQHGERAAQTERAGDQPEGDEEKCGCDQDERRRAPAVPPERQYSPV